MASHRLVSGLPRVFASLPPSPAPPCTPCVADRLRATPHSSYLHPTTTPFQNLHLDVWGPAPMQGPERERYFLVVVDDYSRGEFRSVILCGFPKNLTILDTSGVPFSERGECRIGLVMDIARTSMIHARAPHFLWPYAVHYATHQLNLQPRVSRPEASPTSLWTRSPGVGSAFRVWGCLALVRDTSADKLSAHAIPCVFLGFPMDSPDYVFYHPPLHQFLDSRDVQFDESVSYYTRYPGRGLPVPPPPIFLAPSPPPTPAPPVPLPPVVLPRQSPQQPSTLPRQVAVDSVGVGAGVADTGGARSGGARSWGAGAGGASSGGAGAGGAGTGGAISGGAGAGGTGAGGAGTGGASSAGARAGGSGAGGANTGGASSEGAGAGGTDTGGAPFGDTSTGGASSEETGVGDTTSAVPTQPPHRHDTRLQAARRRAREEQEQLERERQELQQLDLLEQQHQQQQQPQQLLLERQLFPPVSGLRALGLPSSSPARSPSLPTFGPTPSLSPACSSLVPRYQPPHCPLLLFSSSFSTCVRSPVSSSVLSSCIPYPISDYYRAARPVVSRVLATLATDSRFSPSSVSALTAAVTDFASTRRLDYATRVVAAPPPCPLSVGGEFALGYDVLEDRQFELEFLATASPSLCALLLSPEGDPDGLDIPTTRTYCEAVSGEWASQWKGAMDSELASWRSTGTYIEAVPPPRANVVDGMWLFKVKRPPGSPPVFKARYVARGFSQHEGVDFFQTFAPTLKMTTLRVLLHVAAHRDYELHSLDFSTAFHQGRLHEEIWLRRPSGFTDTFPPRTQWSLRRPVYVLRQSPCEWHDTLRSMLRDLGFRPSSSDPSLFVRVGSTPFLILVYVDDLVFATANRAALAKVKSELQKRHTCPDLGELQRYLGLQITRGRAVRTITLTQSHMVQQVLRQFEFQFSTTQPTPLAVDHKLTGPFPDEPFESNGPYAELVGRLMYLMTSTRPDLAFPLSVLSRFVVTGKHRPVHWTAAVRVAKYLATTSGMGLVLGGTQPAELTGHCDSSYVDDAETQRSTQGYRFSLGAGAVLWRSTWSSSVASSTAEAEIYACAMVAQELRWLTFLLTDLGERPRSALTLYADNKAMILLCRKPRLESRVKHIDVRYFLLRELQRRGQARLDFVAS
ncbi:unnamed protein product [Closterium sp. NIES-54]